jgi:hypothetical protein
MEGQTVAGGAFGDEFALVGVDGFAGEEEFQADFFAGPAVVEGVEDFFQRVGFEAVAVVEDGWRDPGFFPAFGALFGCRPVGYAAGKVNKVLKVS